MIRLLDCTLRDGGFYTNWNFSEKFVKDYLEIINDLEITDIEIGYSNPLQPQYRGEYFYSHYTTLKFINSRLQKNKKVWLMVDLKFIKDVRDLSKSLKKIKDFIYGIRMTIPDDFESDLLLSVLKALKQNKLSVSLNIMYAHRYLSRLKNFDKFSCYKDLVDIFAIVDSYGVLSPQQTSDIFKYVSENLDFKYLGFHGHNNLELALSNALQALKYGASIIDCTFEGFGRGAGNLRTELAVIALGDKKDIAFVQDNEALCRVPEIMKEMRTKYIWGPSIPFAIGAKNYLPQSLIMELISLNRYSSHDVISFAFRKNIPQNTERKIEFGNKMPFKEKRGILCVAYSKISSLTQREVLLSVDKFFVTTVFFMGINAIKNQASLISDISTREKLDIILVFEGTKRNFELINKFKLSSLKQFVLPPVNVRNKKIRVIKAEYSLNNLLEAVFNISNYNEFGNLVLHGFDGNPGDLYEETVAILRRLANDFGSISSISETKYPIRQVSVFKD